MVQKNQGRPPESTGRKFTLSRDVPILDGTRRLDLVIRDNMNTLMVVEVKVIGADDAETAKHEDYFDWMKNQKETRRYPYCLPHRRTRKNMRDFSLFPGRTSALG